MRTKKQQSRHADHPNLSAVPRVDELLKEYLAFRGFTSTLRQFDTERKTDRSKSLQSERIVDQLFSHLHAFDFPRFLEYWRYLEIKFFTKWVQRQQAVQGRTVSGSDGRSTSLFTGGTRTARVAAQSALGSVHGGLKRFDIAIHERPRRKQRQSLYPDSGSRTSFDTPSADSTSPYSMANHDSGVDDGIDTREIRMGDNHLDRDAVDSGGSNRNESHNARVGEAVGRDMYTDSSAAGIGDNSSSDTGEGSSIKRDAPTGGLSHIAHGLEQSLKRYYVVHCVKSGKQDKCREFFDQYGEELSSDPHWKPWFMVPWIKSPELHPELEPHFSDQWAAILRASLHNFISTTLLSADRPQLLILEAESRDRYASFRKRLDTLQRENEILKQRLSSAERYIEEIKKGRPSHLESDIESTLLGFSNSKVAPQRNTIAAEGRNDSDTDDDRSSDDSHCSNGGNRRGNDDDDDKDDGYTPSDHAGYEFIDEEDDPRDGGGTVPIATSSQRSHRRDQSISSLINEYASSMALRSDRQGPMPLHVQTILAGHTDEVTQCLFSYEEQMLATASRDRTVRIWPLEDGSSGDTPIQSRVHPERVRSSIVVDCGGIEVISMDWSKKSDRVLVCGMGNRKLKIFKIGDPSAGSQHGGSALMSEFIMTDAAYPRVTCVATSPLDSHYAVVACTTAPSRRGSHQRDMTEIGSTWQSASAADGSVSGGDGSISSSTGDGVTGTLCGHNLQQARLENRFPLDPSSAPILCVQFNHNGHMFVCGSVDGIVRVFDVNTQTPIMHWKAHNGRVTNVYFSSDETSIVSVGSDGKIVEWDIHFQGKILSSLKIPRRHWVGSVDATRDTSAATGSGSQRQERKPLRFSDPFISLSGDSHSCRMVLNDPGIVFAQVHRRQHEHQKYKQFVPVYTLMPPPPQSSPPFSTGDRSRASAAANRKQGDKSSVTAALSRMGAIDFHTAGYIAGVSGYHCHDVLLYSCGSVSDWE